MNAKRHLPQPPANLPRVLRGVVIGLQARQKMIKVEVLSKFRHPRYGKVVIRRIRLNVHWDAEQPLSIGDLVHIMESRPISRIKHHVFVHKLEAQSRHEWIDDDE